MLGDCMLRGNIDLRGDHVRVEVKIYNLNRPPLSSQLSLQGVWW